jgi:hypothetical protein
MTTACNLCPTLADVLNQDAYGSSPAYDNLYNRLDPEVRAAADCYVGCDAWQNAVACGATLAQFLNPANGWFDTSGTGPADRCKRGCYGDDVLAIVDNLDSVKLDYNWRTQKVGGERIRNFHRGTSPICEAGDPSCLYPSPLTTNYCCLTYPLVPQHNKLYP